MITNERQYKISKGVLIKLKQATEAFDMNTAIAECGGDRVLAEAQLRAIESEFESVSYEVKEYKALKSGAIAKFEADSLNDLPLILIRARIAKGLSQRELAEKLGVKEQQVQRYESEKYASASLRRLVEISNALGLKINKKAQLDAPDQKTITPPKLEKIDFGKFPIKEMYKRKWFENFAGGIRDAEANAEVLLTAFLSTYHPQASRAFYRKHIRSGSDLDEYSLLAWRCRILRLAKKQKINTPFKKSDLTKTWFRNLAKLSLKDDGPKRAKEYLKDSGIALVVEPHLPQTFLDGAALLLTRDCAVVGMTLRYDRLDNFWFVLFHELAHLMLHLDRHDVEFFDDVEAEPDPIEKEADEFASEALIPRAAWEKSLAPYFRTPEVVTDAATQFEVNPAVVAGRIRNESKNYIILSDLIGAGLVRKQFNETQFEI